MEDEQEQEGLNQFLQYGDAYVQWSRFVCVYGDRKTMTCHVSEIMCYVFSGIPIPNQIEHT
jgi:hypothetical protein